MTLLNAFLGLAGLLAVTVAFGIYLHWQQWRPSRHDPDELVDPHRLGADSLGGTATLLQFSTEMSSRCPGVHRTLAAVAAGHEGVRHWDVDVTSRPDIAKHFHILQTPTTLVLDRSGAVQARFGGIPTREVVDLELNRLSAETADI